MKRRLVILALAALGLLALVCPDCVSYRSDPEPWLREFEQLKEHTANVYVNLEWALDQHDINAVELADRTTEAIRSARTRGAARDAIAEFVQAFHDPHFRIEKPLPGILSSLAAWWTNDTGGPVSPSMSGADACGTLGYHDADHGFDLPFADAAGATDVRDEGPFQSTLIRLPGGARIGVLRIASFGADGHLDLALEVWREFSGAASDPLTDEELQRFHSAVHQRILDRLAERIEILKGTHLDALLIDITNNGGGTDWVDPAARMLTATPLRSAPLAFIRHPHWARPLSGTLEVLEQALSEPQSGAAQAALRQARDKLDGLVGEVRKERDWSSIWRTGSADWGLPRLVEGGLFSTGILDYLPPDAFSELRCRSELFGPLRYRYQEGLYRGPLFVVMNGNTASASEQFVALLQDNRAATLIGERTLGAGAGYTNGGQPLKLEQLDIVVRLPDLARLRHDGRNECEGVAPDWPLTWDGGGESFVERLLTMLDQRLKP